MFRKYWKSNGNISDISSLWFMFIWLSWGLSELFTGGLECVIPDLLSGLGLEGMFPNLPHSSIQFTSLCYMLTTMVPLTSPRPGLQLCCKDEERSRDIINDNCVTYSTTSYSVSRPSHQSLLNSEHIKAWSFKSTELEEGKETFFPDWAIVETNIHNINIGLMSTRVIF